MSSVLQLRICAVPERWRLATTERQRPSRSSATINSVPFFRRFRSIKVYSSSKYRQVGKRYCRVRRGGRGSERGRTPARGLVRKVHLCRTVGCRSRASAKMASAGKSRPAAGRVARHRRGAGAPRPIEAKPNPPDYPRRPELRHASLSRQSCRLPIGNNVACGCVLQT